MRELRAEALRLFSAGIAAADPEAAVAGRLSDKRPDLIIAVGKAAPGMARAAAARHGGVPMIVVTHRENGGAALPDGARLFLAGHPVPDPAGAEAAQAVLTAAGSLGQGRSLLLLLSGGGSALLPAPAEGITLADKAELNRLLLGSGADIHEMNLIRQQVSRIKGGGLARAAAPAEVTALILSDVVGDDLSIIASGPTAPPAGTREIARERLVARGIWDRLPASVRAHLDRAGTVEPPPPADNILIGSNALSQAAMAAAAPEAILAPVPLTGDVADAARTVVQAGNAGPGTRLWGGETTVRLTGTGLGGRNQELALRVALLAEAEGWQGPWVFLSGGTDGRDGPTEAAGGMVDQGSLTRMRAAGVSPEGALAGNDSNRALAASGDLIVTGATGTNVADLQVLIRS